MDKLLLNERTRMMFLESLGQWKEAIEELEAKAEAKRWAKMQHPISLADALSRLTKEDLSKIRTTLDVRGASSLRKQELIDVLVQQIPAKLPRLLGKMDESRYKILKRLAEGGGIGFVSLTPDQLSYWISRGLVFSGTIQGKKTLVIPQEVLAAFRQADSDPAVQEKVRRNTEWLKITYGCLYYYGTLGLTELQSLLKQHAKAEPESIEYLFVLYEAEQFEKNIRIDLDGTTSHSDVWDPKRVKQEHRARPDLSFRPFSKTQLLRAGEPGYVDRNAQYQAFVQFLCNHYVITREEADQLVEECVYAIQNGEELQDTLGMFQQEMEIDSVDMLQEFMRHIVELHNHTRQWILKGHTPDELFAEEKKALRPLPAAKAEVVDFATRKKVGRNDPCPCGSGKKFKKCCGR